MIKKRWLAPLLVGLALLVMWIAQPKLVVQGILPDFLHAQITEDLGTYTLTQEALDRTWDAVKEGCIRYKLSGNTLYVAASDSIRQHPRYLVITKALQQIVAQPHFPHFDCIVHLGDSVQANPWPAPLFVFAKSAHTKNVILMPDCEALNAYDRQYISHSVTKTGKRIPWDKKEDIVFWRGGPTGPRPSFEEIAKQQWHSAPRFHLVKLAEQFPHLIDAAFVSWSGIQNNPSLCAAFPYQPAVHPKHHIKYKYLIDVDGNSCCYSRTYWILLSNCLMLKQVTDQVQWFYKGLKSGIHYVPVNQDLSDLTSQIAWCQAHDHESEVIANNATAFAANYLQYEMNLLYFSQALKAYAGHLTFTPIIQEEDQEARLPWKQQFIFQSKTILRKLIKRQPIA